MTKAEIAKKVINDAGGIAKTSEFLAAGLYKSDIGKLVSDGMLERIRHGYIKINSYNKIVQKIGKNVIFNKKTSERSSDKLGNFPRCVL